MIKNHKPYARFNKDPFAIKLKLSFKFNNQIDSVFSYLGGDQAGSEASVGVLISRSLCPVKSIE